MPLEEAVGYLSTEMHGLGTGSLVALRRMPLDGPGPMAFWHLVRRCGLPRDETKAWMQITKILATLISNGGRGGASTLHDDKQPLGSVFCDGGRSDWHIRRNAPPRPFLSETRLSRFLLQPHGRRAETLERIARKLAVERDPGRGIDCSGIAKLLLYPNDKAHLRCIAYTYYQRLDSATGQHRHERTAA